jgi:DNA-binding NarL/FixJ family response regulator
MCIQVLVVDDQARSRHSLMALLTATAWSTPGADEAPTPAHQLPVRVAGEAADSQQAVEQVSALRPEVVVLDLHPNSHLPTVPMSEPKLDGMATIRTIKSRWPAIRIVVLAMYATDRAAALAAGADVFLLKGCPTQELLDALTSGAPAVLGQ